MLESILSSPESADSEDLSPWEAATYLVGLYLVAVVLRILVNGFVSSPHIFTDELQYVEMGRSLSAGGGLYWGERAIDFPCWLYPLLIAPFLSNFEMEAAHAWILRMNVLLGASTLFFAYGLAREVAGRRRALVAAALVALLPSLGFSAMVMVESLFLALFTLAFWLGFRAIDRPTPVRMIAAGLAFGFAFHAKPQALFLPLIYALTVILIELLRFRRTPTAERKPLRLLGAIARHGIVAAAWLIVLLPRMYVVINIENHSNPWTIDAFLGSYAWGSDISKPMNLVSFSFVFLGSLAIWALATGLFPIGRFARELIGGFRHSTEPRIGLMAIMIAVAALVIHAFISRHTLVIDSDWYIYERYFLVIIPPVLAIFCARDPSSSSLSRSSWSLRMAALSFVGFVALAAWIIAHHMKWGIPSSVPTLGGALLALVPENVPTWVWVVYIGLLVLTLGAIIFAGRDFKRQSIAIGLLLVCFNFGWYATHQIIAGPSMREHRHIAAEVDDALPANHKLLILSDGLRRETVWNTGFFNAGSAVHFSANDELWFSSRLELDADGRVSSPFDLNRTWILCGASWRFNKFPEKYFGEAALYRVGGRNPLRFDLSQVNDHVSFEKPIRIERGGRNFIDSLELSYLYTKLPEHWNAGKTAKVRLVILNDGASALPYGDFRFALGYHWSDPERTGKWDSIVWDDGRNVSLSRGLGAGKIDELELEILAPDNPGPRWSLTIAPFFDDGEERIWATTKNQLAEWVSVQP